MQLWHSAQGHLPAAEAMAAGGQGQGDGGVGEAAGGDGGVPEGGRVCGAWGQKGELTHGTKTQVHDRVLCPIQLFRPASSSVTRVFEAEPVFERGNHQYRRGSHSWHYSGGARPASSTMTRVFLTIACTLCVSLRRR